MKLLADKTNVIAPDATYEFGSVKDNTGANDGTPADRDLFSDGMQFFEKLMAESDVTANGLPDNTVNGYQLYEAFRRLTHPYKVYTALVTQSGTSAPVLTVLGYNTLNPAYGFFRDGVGVYTGSLPGELPIGKTWVIIDRDQPLGHAEISHSVDTVQIRTFNTGGTPADGILASTSFEIRVYD